MPTVGPMTYAAAGAAVASNGALMVFGLIRDAIGHRRRQTVSVIQQLNVISQMRLKPARQGRV
jgi:hypothetical protein